MIIPFRNKKPNLLSSEIFIADGAKIIGNVTIHPKCSIWFNAVLRGDIAEITIGSNTNIQDNCTIHVDDTNNTKIGSNVTIGHNAIIHGCTIEDNCLIGMGSTILDGAVIGSGSIVGANSLVTSNTIIPPNSLVLGAPAKIVKSINVYNDNLEHAEKYFEIAQEYFKASNTGEKL